MPQTTAEIETRLTSVRSAIAALVGGALSYTIAGRTFTRQDLRALQDHEDWLERKLSQASDAGGSGIFFVSDTSCGDGITPAT